MTHARPKGPIQGEARRGFDAAYAEQQEAGRRERDDSMTGRNTPYGVASDDTAMKNPDGDLSRPAAMPVKPQGRG
jgi:hypothetical protein